MPKLIVEEAKEFLVLPADSIVHLKIEETSTREVQGRTSPYEKLEFKFKILGIQAVGDGSPVSAYESVIGAPIWGSVTMKLTASPENRLRQWAEAILGIELGVGFELDTDLFDGREVRGITSQYDKKAINPTTGQPYRAHQVESLLRKAAPSQQAPTYAQPPQGYAQQPPAPPVPPVQQQQQLWNPVNNTTVPQPQPAGGAGWDEPPF